MRALGSLLALTKFIQHRRLSYSITPLHLHEQTLVSFLDTCSNFVSLRKIHAFVIVVGLQNHIFLSSKLLSRYAHYGCLAESRRVFNRIINRNLSLWNSILVGYFRTHHYIEVLSLFSKLKQLNIGIDSLTLTVVLKSCAENGVVEFGRGVHVNAVKLGLHIDRYVGSSLIGFYSKCGDIGDARKVFDEMSDRDIVTHTAMITAYAQVDDFCAYDAFKIVMDLQKASLDPNRVTLVSLLQVASKLRLRKEGRFIHGYAIRRGMDCFDEILETSLMNVYIKTGSMNEAESIFRRMHTKNNASWNALISGYIQNGQPCSALDVFYRLVMKNRMPDLISLANGLLGCADLKLLRQGKSIHGHVIRSGIDMDLIATTALIDMYSKCNCVAQAEELFDGVESRDVILFNVLIAAYLENGLAEKAMKTFDRMVKSGVTPNLATMFNVLSAYADLKDIKSGMGIHGYIVRRRLEHNTEIANHILYMYAKCGRIDLAREVFNRVTSRDLVSWTSMMMGCVNYGHADEALALFCMMQKDGMQPDSVTLVTLLKSFSQLGSLKLAMEIHGHAYRIQLDIDIPLIDALATTYAKCGRLDIARVLFECTSQRDLKSWNTVIAAHALHGNCEEALEFFGRMCRDGVEPDESTFTSLLSACSHAGLVEEGLRLFHSMTADYSISPCEKHYSCMVDLLGRAGRLKEAYDLLICFPLSRSTSALTALLSACRLYKNLELGELVGRKLMDIVPECSSTYALLSNIYAEAGKWTEMSNLRTHLIYYDLKKLPGHSMLI
ncbi:hypothetical protein Scep_016922 [Stephania cephalantha]|uniref:Pentatricopeptide repeat-containing protein n=1 Tax=Stephania cephalantha TaxID=152367 RepID=A0AAP0INH3_9MAGN